MTRPLLTIDLDAIAANWAALDRLSAGAVETGAVVKADAYGLGVAAVSRALRAVGASRFFVAVASEAVAVRAAVGPGPEIFVFAGYTPGDGELLRQTEFRPMLNSPQQVSAFAAEHPDLPCGLQLDTGMNRLGLEPEDLGALDLGSLDLRLVMSHLACADDPSHPQNAAQRGAFQAMTGGFAPELLSLAATGGVLLGPDYHFAVTRPGIGLYGGQPFADARPVVRLSVPVLQVRDVAVGESVGYGAAWVAARPSRIATLAVGYADGLLRALSGAVFHAEGVACPVVGRVSMDLITVDVTDLPFEPDTLDVLGPDQGIDALAAAAGTIGYEVLTALGSRYERVYKGG